MKLLCHRLITRDDVEFFELMLKDSAVEPGQLFPRELGHNATLINQLLYDAFHSKGWNLDLVSGKFVRAA